MQSQPLDLAIVGVPKSGTTSLFTWLSAHPGVQGSEPKETFYFIDFDRADPQAPTFDDEGWEGFKHYFPEPRAGRLRLEASPSSLYSEMALRAFTSLEVPPLVIAALRCPAEQIRSGFYFSQNNGAAGRFIAPDLTFPAYVEALLGGDHAPLVRAVPDERLRWYLTESLNRDKYVGWLDRWSERLPPEALLVIGFDDLTGRPRETMEEVCKHAGLDDSFFADYEFARVNPTLAQPSSRLRRLATFVNQVLPEGRLHDALGGYYRRRLRPSQYIGSAAPGEETAAMTALGDYFGPSNQALAERYGVDVSSWWPRAST